MAASRREGDQEGNVTEGGGRRKGEKGAEGRRERERGKEGNDEGELRCHHVMLVITDVCSISLALDVDFARDSGIIAADALLMACGIALAIGFEFDAISCSYARPSRRLYQESRKPLMCGAS